MASLLEQERSHSDAPFMQGVMRDPVLAACGHTFERAAIEAWLKDHDTSPQTGEVLPSKDLIANYTLRSLISQRP